IWALQDGKHISLAANLALVIPGFLYFWVAESLWGCTPGKWLVRLRVTRAGTWEQPGVWRILWRTTVFFVTSGVVGIWLLYAVLDRTDRLAWAVWQLAIAGLGLLIRCSTMRPRNGFRGLHEFLSGTQVMRLPPPRDPAFRGAKKVSSAAHSTVLAD